MANLDANYKEFAFLALSEMRSQLKIAGVDQDTINHATRNACKAMFREPADIQERLGVLAEQGNGFGVLGAVA